MEISQLLVMALVAGASAALRAGADGAVRAAYERYRAYLVAHYGAVAGDVARLEQRPEQVSRQQVIADELAAANAGADGELVRLAQQLLAALAQQPGQIIGARVEDVQEAAVKLRDIVAQGTGNVTGVAIRGVQGGVIEIEQVRASGLPPAAPAAGAARRIKILFLAANPAETTRLRLDEEARAIDQALRLAEYRLFDIQAHWAVRIGELQELLLRHQPDIVHFCGHGSAADELVLQDEVGQPRLVKASSLRSLFRVFREQIRCVVLNACFSDSQAAVIAEEVACVVGMSGRISDEAARAFAAAFYGSLGYAQSVGAAFELGCNRIDLHNLGEAHRPLLVPRAGVKPETLYFVDPKV